MKSSFVRIFKAIGACSFLFVFTFLVGLKAFSAEPTLLRLNFKDAQGQPVKGTTATLVLVVGNYVDKLPLKVSPNGLDITMDASWLSAHWPGKSSRIKNLDRVFLFLKAPGFAPLCSFPINWMGSEKGGLDKAGNQKPVVVSFPHNNVMVVLKGQTNTFDLSLRKPTERFVKLSAGKGIPVVGAKVKTYVYWSTSDNGELNDADFLDEGTSDKTGRVAVADGDFTYAIKVTYKATHEKPAQTVIVLKRFEEKEYPVFVPMN